MTDQRGHNAASKPGEVGFQPISRPEPGRALTGDAPGYDQYDVPSGHVELGDMLHVDELGGFVRVLSTDPGPDLVAYRVMNDAGDEDDVAYPSDAYVTVRRRIPRQDVDRIDGMHMAVHPGAVRHTDYIYDPYRDGYYEVYSISEHGRSIAFTVDGPYDRPNTFSVRDTEVVKVIRPKEQPVEGLHPGDLVDMEPIAVRFSSDTEQIRLAAEESTVVKGVRTYTPNGDRILLDTSIGTFNLPRDHTVMYVGEASEEN